MGLRREIRGRRPVRAALALGLVALLAFSASAHEVSNFWQYDKSFWNHKWKEHIKLRERHRRWHAGHPSPTRTEHRRYHHRLYHWHAKMHHHDVQEIQRGTASWYEGKMGACGKRLRGRYAAHPTWPCGSLVSVRRGDKYVFVRIRDRGPSRDDRIIDLSKEAFARLRNPDRGLLDVKIYLLED
jgi:rare lipoprotein A (peptidoglycan hydrolase)